MILRQKSMKGEFFFYHCNQWNLFFDLVLLHIELSVLRNWFLAYSFGNYMICYDLRILIVSLIICKNFTNPCTFVFVVLGVGCVHILRHLQRVLEYSLPCWHSLDIIVFSQHCTGTWIALSIYARRALHGICDINPRIMDIDQHWILN